MGKLGKTSRPKAVVRHAEPRESSTTTERLYSALEEPRQREPRPTAKPQPRSGQFGPCRPGTGPQPRSGQFGPSHPGATRAPAFAFGAPRSENKRRRDDDADNNYDGAPQHRRAFHSPGKRRAGSPGKRRAGSPGKRRAKSPGKQPRSTGFGSSDRNGRDRPRQAFSPSKRRRTTNGSVPLHVVFIVDTSGSMAKDDAQVGGRPATRIEAVIECMSHFVEQTAADLDAGLTEVYSVISFADVALPLCAAISRAAFNRVGLRKSLRCGGGTNFSAAFHELGSLVAGTNRAEQTHVVFLSDGRPGDLKWPPPRYLAQAPATYKKNGIVRRSAIAVGQLLRKQYGGSLSYSYISVGPEKASKAWLAILVQVTGGQCMHHEDMSVGGAPAPQRAATAPARRRREVLARGFVDLGRGGGGGRGGAVEACAAAAGEASSLRDTFTGISSSLTASANRKARRLRPVVFETAEAHMYIEEGEVAAERVYGPQEVTRLRLRQAERKGPLDFVPVVGGPERTLTIRHLPFAVGGQRLAFTAFLNGSKVVAKESKFHERTTDRRACNIGPYHAHLVADDYADRFNNALQRAWDMPVRAAQYPASERAFVKQLSIRFVPSDCYQLKDSKTKGGFRYVTVEKHLAGTYFKYNGNNGYIGPPAAPGSLSAYHQAVADAFTHYTWHESKNTVMVCDVQGVGLTFTDPSVLSVQKQGREKRFGKTDIGMSGISAFMRKHTCSPMCRVLGLPPAISGAGGGGGGGGGGGDGGGGTTSVSLATSQWSMDKTMHLQQRKNERGIDTRECQAAVKHGAHKVVRNGRVLHRHKDISLITDASGKVGVTAWREDGSQAAAAAPDPPRPAPAGDGAKAPAGDGDDDGAKAAAARPAASIPTCTNDGPQQDHQPTGNRAWDEAAAAARRLSAVQKGWDEVYGSGGL